MDNTSHDHITSCPPKRTVIVMTTSSLLVTNVCVYNHMLSKYLCFLSSLIPLSCNLRWADFVSIHTLFILQRSI